MQDVGESLVFFTPFLTGLASSNWNVTVNQPVTAIRRPTDGVKGEVSLQAIQSQVSRIDVGGSVLFQNPVEYVPELDGGSSRQAPAGMTRPTLSRLERFWINNLRSNNISR